MSQRDLVAKHRAYRVAEERLQEARAALEEEIRHAVETKEWPIVDVAELTGWSRETVRKIAKPKPAPDPPSE